MKNKIFFTLVSIFCFFAIQSFAQKQYNYIEVPNDPLKARIYTLDNGLKVYMTVYKDAPRIQTYVAVRAGSKNDPAETTGLAHYFEHMMFKGTSNYGTKDWKSEEPLIAKIDSLFEVYRKLTDEDSRKKLYQAIDSISYIASTYAIPNEYDKLMSSIGATGTNAYTSLEETVYVDNIPSNQLENWAIIQADRFSNPVLRLFHTELETIYEEKNMTLTNDARKAYTAMLEGLFNYHPYGTQTTIGTQEHIKNPSMKNIREFFAKYYVPNNMAVCLSGDFDPDVAIKIIDEKFGKLKKSNVPEFAFKKEEPIVKPVIKEVFGNDAENIILAYRFDGSRSKDAEMITLIDMLLTNGTAGLIDLNLNQKQKVLSAGSNPNIMHDYSVLMLTGKPKAGQSLDEVKDLLLSQIELIKKGEFPDWLMKAVINDLKLRKIKDFEDNDSRAMAFVESFIQNIDWADYIKSIDNIAKITKQEVIDFANKNLNDNYVLVYKRKGKDESIKKVKKPKITPIKINRDDQSAFLKMIQANKVAEIEPVFIDFKKDIQSFNLKNGLPLIYKQNKENNTFNLVYLFDMGNNNDKEIVTVLQYIKFLGTTKYSDEQLKQEFYKIGCSWDINSSADQMTASISGLSENIEPAIKLFEEIITDCQPNQKALDNLVNDIIKKRGDNKLNPQRIFSAMVSYGIYGPKSPITNILSEKELKALKAENLVKKVRDLFSYQHRVLYYGSHTNSEISDIINKYHKIPDNLKQIPAEMKFVEKETNKNIVYHVDFDSKQSQLLMLNKGGLFNKDMTPKVTLFNEYFGGSMNSIVFQELREARSLAYTAMSMYQSPQRKDRSYMGISYIATQNDKLSDALEAMTKLLNELPESDKSFNLAKNSIIQKMRTDRITKSDILWSYENAKKLGIDYDIRKDIFDKVQNMTINDVKEFHNQYIKNKTHTYLVLGDKKETNFDVLKKYGKVKYLKLEEIFGY